jgi:uncharacterized protein YggE
MDAPSPAAVPTVAVRGSWTAEVPPELARVRVTLSARHADRAHALRDLTRRIEEVQAVLAGYGEAVTAVESGTLWVRPQFKDRKPTERVAGYLAGLQLTATVVDFTVLGDLLLRAADRDMVSIDGPFWSLREDSDVHRRARVEAVRDARRRAEEYAEAAGSRLTGLIEIADTGLSSDNVVMAGAPAAMFRVGTGGSVADDVEIDLTPVPQTVHASVEARFTLSPPDFGASS